MQSMFRVPWCTNQVATKISDQVALMDTFRASPVLDMPSIQKLKRKRIDSMDTFSVQPTPMLNKKQRPTVETALPAQKSSQPTMLPTPTSSIIATPEVSFSSSVVAPKQALLPAQAKPDIAPSTHVPCVRNDSTAGLEDVTTAIKEDATMLDVKQASDSAATSLSRLQQVIDNEFNMQILMKHNELRLIEQELAKCQIALDQLRRCEIRPFPGDVKPCESVTAGTGPAILAPPGCTLPKHPSPYGVTDGPYSKHYRTWLLQDAEFDPMVQRSPSFEDQASLAARSTRNNGARKSTGKTIGTSMRTDSMHSIPNYPAPAHKDKSAALVLKRSTDGLLVKLICNNCQRGNFSSIQGFLNHCRIAHKVDYKSHDLAAIDCGRPLDEAEVANLPVETQNAPVPKPTVPKTASAVSTPARNLVHPMNLPGKCSTSSRNGHNSASGARNAKAVPAASKLTSHSAHRNQAFKPASDLPHLSAQFAKHKFGGNLQEAILAAKQQIDFGVDELVSSPDVTDLDSPLTPVAGARTVLGANQAHNARPVSRKGHRESVSAPRHRPSPLVPPPAAQFHAHVTRAAEIPESPLLDSSDHLAHLSPHTADSNPGLVSDHDEDDDDHGSEGSSEDDSPARHPLGPSRRTCGGHEGDEMDVEVEDGLASHGVLIRRNSMTASPLVANPSKKI